MASFRNEYSYGWAGLVCAILLMFQAANGASFENERGDDTGKMSAMDLIVSANMKYDISHLIEGDIVPSKKRNAVAIEAWKWTGHSIPYEIDSAAFSTYGLSVIREAIDQFNSDVSCIKYMPRQNEKDYVRIVHGYGCHSSIGRDGGRQDVTLGDDCYYKGVVMHELTHAVGFFHEQSRYDRDKYVEVEWENIMDGKDRDFVAESRNILNTLDSPYDYGSIMHYGATTFSKNGNPTLKALFDDKGTMGQRDGFSAVDIWKINKLYACTKSDPPAPVWWMIGSPTTAPPTVTPATPNATPISSETTPTSSTTPTTAPIKPCQLDPSLPPGLAGPPETFDAVVFQNSLRVFWSTPCSPQTITAFVLTYWQTGGRRISLMIDPTKQTHYISTALHPGRKFYMAIATQTTTGEGPTSHVISTYSACGYDISLKENGTFDKIHSPYFSKGYYEPDVACQWTITVPKGQRLKVKFIALDLVTNDRCDGDFVTVNDVMLCNHLPANGYILSENSTTKITFYSKAGQSNKRGGFRMFVSVDGNKPQNVTTTTLPGLIRIFWEAPEGKAGKLYNYDLKYRLVPDKHVSEVRLDPHTHGFPIATGGHFGRLYEIDVATVDVSQGVNVKGASYNTKVRTACGRNLTVAQTGVLRSPHYPQSYEPDTVCEWNLMIEDGYQLTLTFNDLDLQAVPDCLLDYVDITNIGRYCTPSDVSGRTHVTRSKVTTVTFVSNEAIELQGFELQYTKTLIARP